MIEQRWVLFLIGWGLAAALQGVLYLRQRQTRDATLVDAGWAFTLALLAVLYALLAPGGIEHRVLIAVLVSVESLRIAWLVAKRIGHGEDTRYAELRPSSEEQSLRSRGDDYRRYQQETSAFVPLPPRSPA